MPNCAVLSCKNSTKKVGRDNGNISFHRFPSDPNIKQKWIKATGHKHWFPTKYSRFCSVHFIESSFTETKKFRRLTAEAIPTIDVLKTSTNDETKSQQRKYSQELTSRRDSSSLDDEESGARPSMDSDFDDVGDRDDMLVSKKNSAATERASSFKPVHREVACNNCQKEIAGHRYMCLQCADCNLCSTCETSGLHPHHCMLRLPCPTVYASVEPFLLSLKYALNNGPVVSEDVLEPDSCLIKEEPEDEEPLIETGDHNTVPTTDPLAEPKLENDEDGAAGEDEPSSKVNTETRTHFKIENSAKEAAATITNLPCASRATNTSFVTHKERAQQQQSTKRKISDLDDKSIKYNSMRVEAPVEVRCGRIETGLSIPDSELLQVYDIKIETEIEDVEQSMTD